MLLCFRSLRSFSVLVPFTEDMRSLGFLRGARESPTMWSENLDLF